MACHKKHIYNLPQSKHIRKIIFKGLFEDAEREKKRGKERERRKDEEKEIEGEGRRKG